MKLKHPRLGEFEVSPHALERFKERFYTPEKIAQDMVKYFAKSTEDHTMIGPHHLKRLLRHMRDRAYIPDTQFLINQGANLRFVIADGVVVTIENPTE